MKDYLVQRVIDVAEYTIKTGSTLRDTAERFGVSKSTIHVDLVHRLPQVKPNMVDGAQQVLAYNKSVRSLRGGEATKRMYQERRMQDEASQNM